MDVFTSIEWLTQIATLVMFATGIPPCWHMYKTGSTRGVPYTFFLMGGVNNIMAVYYGILTNNSVILFLNIVGMILNFSYAFVYVHVSVSKRGPLFLLAVGWGWLLGLAYYLTVHVQCPVRVTYQLGMILCVMTTVLLTLPVLEIGILRSSSMGKEKPREQRLVGRCQYMYMKIDCIKQKSVSDMSLAMLFGGLTCSGLWLFYGILLGDFFIYAPNFPGLATGVGKLVLLASYGGNGRKTRKKVE